MRAYVSVCMCASVRACVRAYVCVCGDDDDDDDNHDDSDDDDKA